MVRVSIGGSAGLAWVLCLGHTGAAMVLLPVFLPAWIKTLIAVAILASLLRSLMRVALLKTADAVVAVEIKDEGEISFRTRRGEWRDGRLSGSSYVSSWLTILLIVEERQRNARSVVIVPDNVDADEFRRLRVKLRWGGMQKAA